MSTEYSEQPPAAVDSELLPANYDCLVPIEKLVLGEHNPRQVLPKSSLRRSTNKHGINLPLIVRLDPNPDIDIYHITDGWKHY